MSMSGEDLERTGIMRKILDQADHDDDMTLMEGIEEFEERIDFLDIEEDKKEKYKKLVQDIKEEKDERAQEFLFHQLVKIINEE